MQPAENLEAPYPRASPCTVVFQTTAEEGASYSSSEKRRLSLAPLAIGWKLLADDSGLELSYSTVFGIRSQIQGFGPEKNK